MPTILLRYTFLLLRFSIGQRSFAEILFLREEVGGFVDARCRTPWTFVKVFLHFLDKVENDIVFQATHICFLFRLLNFKLFYLK